MRLVAVAQALEDLHGLLRRGLGHLDLLEAALQGGVPLQVLAVLVHVVAPMVCSSPRASAGLRMLAASMAPSAAPAPTRLCSSSMNRMMSPCSRISFMTFLSRSSNSPRYLEPATSAARSSVKTCLPLSSSGHLVVGDALREALDDGRLAHARLADEHGVVLGAPREDLHDALDLGWCGRCTGRACRLRPACVRLRPNCSSTLASACSRRRRCCRLAPARGPRELRMTSLRIFSGSASRSSRMRAATPSSSRIRPSRMCSVPM